LGGKYRWYEKLFFTLQLKQKKYFWLSIGLLVALMMVQFALTNGWIRKKLVLIEWLEGEPVKFYKSLSDR
jgi:hypothetical protein